MTEMKYIKHNKTCPSCGAPLVSEICPYCGIATGLNSAEADVEYPILKCKEASLNFWNVGIPMIFVVLLGFIGIITFPLGKMFDHFMNVIVVPSLLFCSIALFFVIRSFSRYFKVKIKGKMTKATVYGYVDGNLVFDNQPTLLVKLLVQTQNGPRFILYNLVSTLKPYGINDNIDIMVYDNYYMILKKKEVVNW